MTTTKCDCLPVPFKMFHRIAEKMHALHVAHKAHSALKEDEEKRKEIVRKAKEKNWPGLFPKKPAAEKPKPASAEAQKHGRHELLLAHLARHLKKQKEAA